jgi:hypothetical protein
MGLRNLKSGQGSKGYRAIERKKREEEGVTECVILLSLSYLVGCADRSSDEYFL